LAGGPWFALKGSILRSHAHIVSILGCVTVTRPFCLILELCEDNLLNLLHAKAQMLRRQREVDEAQVPLDKTVKYTGVASPFQDTRLKLLHSDCLKRDTKKIARELI
jgi:hypothetical protein